MRGLTMDVPLSTAALLRRAETLFAHKAIVTRRADGTLERSTYGACLAGARRLAAAVRRLGVGPGDCVATLCWNHEAHLQACYGIPASAAVLHTVNVRLRRDDLAHVIQHGESAALIVDEASWPGFEAVRGLLAARPVVFVPARRGGEVPHGTLSYWALLDAERDAPAFADVDERAAAVLCHTSGTTGRPKGVVYSHRALVLHSLAMALPDAFDLGEGARVLALAPMFHANAWGLPLACAMVGASQVLAGRTFEPAGVAALIAAERVTHTAGVPTMCHALLEHLDAHPGRDLSSWKTMLVGGAAIPPETVRAFDERLGVRIVHSWGMTETAPLGTASPLASELEDAPPEEQYAWRARAGRPAPLVEIRARGSDGALVPWDDEALGELEVRGPWVAAAYHPGGEGNEQWTSDGWLRTGDIVTIGPTGSVAVRDRAKDLVKSGGEWISSVALESALLQHPEVEEAVVVAAPHPKWGERPLAVVVPKPGCAPTIESLRAHLAPSFPKWWLPDAVVLVDALPRTASGKYEKHLIRRRWARIHDHVGSDPSES
jgi:fatty-acyl-CoA synthase